MGLSAPGIAITVVTCFLVAAVVVVLAVYFIITIIDDVRRRRAEAPFRLLDADYQAARRAMSDAAGQSWRNIID